MAGSLVKISEDIVTSSQSSVTLTGIDDTYDVYKLVINNLVPVTINSDVYLLVTEGGSVSNDSDYDEAAKQLRSDTTFGDLADANRAFWVLSGSLNNTAGKGFNCEVYIFNASNSSEHTYVTIDSLYISEDLGTLLGIQGGGVYTQTTAVDGVHIKLEGPTSNIATGTFTLYGIKK